MRRQPSLPSAAVMALMLGLCGCGSGGTNPPLSGNLVSILAPGVPSEDGVAYSNQTFRVDGVLPQTGDLGAPGSVITARQFFSFDLSAVPAGSIVTSAVLRVDAFVVVGTPFTTLGAVHVDHLDYGALDGLDFGARAITDGVGVLAEDATLGARSLDVTDAVTLDVALRRPRSQFRLRFSPAEWDGDLANDFVSFAESEAASSGNGQAPVLALVVRVPR
jgi:hypothetical protein